MPRLHNHISNQFSSRQCNYVAIGLHSCDNPDWVVQTQNFKTLDGKFDLAGPLSSFYILLQHNFVSVH